MKVQKRRRRENKTDYLKRLKLLKGESSRVVFRKTNKYIIAQYFLSEEAQDKAIIGIDSRELIKYGWPKEGQGSLKSISASYLTGYLIGKKILKEKLANPILDTGMIRIIHKNKVYAFINGMIDAGIKINCNKKFFPEEPRIKGENLKLKISFNEIKSKIEQM